MAVLKAPLGSRMVACIIDFIAAATLLVFSSAVGYSVFLSVESAFLKVLALFIILISLLLTGGFVLFRDGLSGGEGFGKRLVRLRVVRCDGSRCDFLSSALRNVTLLVPPLIPIEFVLAVVDREGIRVGDRIAKTQVVE